MISDRAQELTAQFYEWEILGRGWLLAVEPIELEPPFTPFFGHFLNHQPIQDDGLRHTLLSSIASIFKKEQALIVKPTLPEISYQPFLFKDDSLLIAFQLILPKNYKVGTHETDQFHTMLSYCTRPVSFEIIGTREAINLQIVSRAEDSQYIKSQLTTLFKGITVLESIVDYDDLIDERLPLATVDFGLKEEFMRPLSTGKTSIDPYTGIFSILENLGSNEKVIIQVLFNGVVNSWQPSIIRSVSDSKGGGFFKDAPEMLPMAKEKTSNHFFAATLRVLTQGETLDESFDLLSKLSFALAINSRSQGNSLTALSDSQYTLVQRIKDIVFRESHRLGMLLNSRELATFVHLPDPALISKKLLGDVRKTKSASTNTEGHAFKLGQNVNQGIEKTVTLSNEQRLKHTHIIGATGTGKSTLLLSMICQDIENGEGVTVLDPHGDLIDSILSKIPNERINDVIVIDPADSEYPIAFNILKAHSDVEKEVLSSDLVAAFKRLSTSWGDQMNSVFANAILAFLESERGGTLIDIRRFLIEKSYREQFLASVKDPNVKYYWQKEYPLLKTSSIGPILTRLDTFLRPRLIRNMVAQQKGIDFRGVLDKRKILLVKLSQGLIGAENSFLLGTFVVSKIHQAALARQVSNERSDFFLYIDEFQHFITPSMSHILSGARKYHLGLILAHQDMQQLQKYDAELLNTLIANAGTRICFRLGDADARKLADGFSYFDAHDLQNLNTGQAIVRIERPEHDFSISTIPFESSNENYAEKESVIYQSQIRYSTSKEEVEKLLLANMSDVEIEEPREARMARVESKKEVPRKDIEIEQSKPVFKSNLNPDEALKEVIQKKEETQHRYLQNLIKKLAESKGYKTAIEMLTPDGKGKVDVSLERDGVKIAVEVSVTTDAAWEIHNIEKCLKSGYKTVIACTADSKTKKSLIEKVSETFDAIAQRQILVFEPDELFLYFDKEMAANLSSETLVKGYRVKVDYEAISKDDMQRKRESITKVILDSMKKLKNP